MANRRKFLAGLGALASGSAAAVGTGAFTSVSANRSLNVSTAGDSQAYLTLDAAVSPHAEQTGDTVEFQFDGSSSANGQGLNEDADTTFTDVLRVENKGTEPVRLQLFSGTGSGAFGSFAQGPLVVSYSDDELAPQGKGQTSSTAFASSPDAPSYWAGPPEGDVNQQDLGVGEDLYIHFSFFLSDRTNFGASNDIADVPSQIIFNAGSTSTSGGDFS